MIDANRYTENIRELCMRYYLPKKTLPDGKPNPSDHPSMRAEAISAASCMVSIARIFKMLETGEPAFIINVVVDLSFGLSENQFWKQHTDVLVPAFKSALGVYLGAVALSTTNEISVEKNSLVATQKRQWHSIFLTAYDCLYGLAETVAVAPIFSQDIVKVV
jgi:hypothetical protein